MRAVSNGATDGRSIVFSNKANENKVSSDVQAVRPATEQIYRVKF